MEKETVAPIDAESQKSSKTSAEEPAPAAAAVSIDKVAVGDDDNNDQTPTVNNDGVDPPPVKRKKESDDEKVDSGDGGDGGADKPSEGVDSKPSKVVLECQEGVDEVKVSPEEVAAPVSSAEEDKKSLRSFKRIPIFIVDYHNDVLEFVYRCLASRYLPFYGNTLIHFDSHPDLVISRDIPASSMSDKETMLAELSIENWIMPLCYTGNFNRVIWIKNSWCQQIPVGKYDFKIGHKDDKVSVDSPLDYFISEGNYVESGELQNARDMHLLVYNSDDAENTIDPTEFITDDNAKNYILDIDLDFFSASNPFLEIYKDAQCYEQLTAIFRFETDTSDSSSTTERRKLQLEELKRIFEHLEEARSLEGLEAVNKEIIPDKTFEKISHLVVSLKNLYADDEIDWLLIFDSGSTTDTNGLPHHVSTSKELEQYFESFTSFLQRLPHPPVAITIACSAEDDYCPKSQVSLIQEKVLSILRETFGEKLHQQPILHYLDEEFNLLTL